MNLTYHKPIEHAPSLITRRLPFWVEPARAFEQLAHLPGSVLLESQPGAICGRHSIICTRPFGVLCTKDKKTRLPDGRTETTSSPFAVLRDTLSAYSLPADRDAVFPGGAVGFLGYELGTFIEDVPVSTSDDQGLLDCWIGLYNCAAIFDHLHRTIRLNGCILDGAPSPVSGLEELEGFLVRMHDDENGGRAMCLASMQTRALSSCFTKTEYCDAVTHVKEYIAAGDVYQVNLSQRFTVRRMGMEPWELYRRLRTHNPAPYAAYLNTGAFQIISSSPECFLDYDPTSRIALTRPIKGTRPRSDLPEEDRRLALELAASEKDMAENVMIVDLERNDLGRVCEFGSVTVPDIARVESHQTVHHLVSTVTGQLRRECDAVDLLAACFPGGSITGAPKIRAMQIIDELERVRRGVYTGSIGYLGFDGSINLNIAIRTAIVQDDTCYLHVGGGIVADSDPEMEYAETLDKGRAFFEVLRCR